jgi:MOSC domain
VPALIATAHVGTVIWLGRVARPAGTDLIIHGEALDEMALSFAGYEGEVHAGLTRPACSRVSAQYPKGTEIRNTRQVSIVSAEELAEVAAALGLEAVDPAWLGAGVVIAGIPDFSHIPPSSRLQGEGGATLVVDMENLPCLEPARTIEAARPGHGTAFKAAARGRRGVTAWVEREGVLRPGERIRLHVPTQRAWAHLAETPRPA